MKRQTPLPDSMESRHTLNVDINSRTFTDVSFRYASRKDGITASMSSPSTGFLGLHFQRKSPSQLYGKLFSRYLSTPEKDTDVFTAKATLRNSQKLILQMSWNLDFLHNAIEGTKDRIPAMNNAVLNIINKYHTAHFGFDLNRGSMKLKNSVSNAIERAYNEVPMSLNSLQRSVKHLGESINVQDVVDKLAHETKEVLKHVDRQIIALQIEVKELMNATKFTMPGSEEKLSTLDMFDHAHRSVSRATDRAMQRFASLMEKVSRLIKGIEFTIPGTKFIVNGNEIMEKLEFTTRSAYDQLRESLHRAFSLLHETVNSLFQVIAEKTENFRTYLKEENVEIASQVDAVYGEVLKSSKHHIEKARRKMANYKDLTKLKIQEAYDALNMESANNNTVEFISILQSHFYGGLNEGLDLMRRASQSTAPYIRVTNKKTDIEIPLPFRWKSFSSWPTQSSPWISS
nr:PREDICTED: uncharacterized protein LOC109643721 [Paralichthys olivaceus]